MLQGKDHGFDPIILQNFWSLPREVVAGFLQAINEGRFKERAERYARLVMMDITDGKPHPMTEKPRFTYDVLLRCLLDFAE